MKKLSEMLVGSRGRVARVGLAGGARQRLIEMGLTAGATFELVRFAPLGDPLEIKLRGYHLSLRRQEAESVEVEPLS